MVAQVALGHTAEIEITVADRMRAQFDDGLVHEIYSTSSLVHHMEWVARKAILPFLEEHEEAMGCHVDVAHLKPTLIGMKVQIRATVSEVLKNKIVCDVEAFNGLGKIAKGYVTQAVLDKGWLDLKKKELWLLHHLAEEANPQPREGVSQN